MATPFPPVNLLRKSTTATQSLAHDMTAYRRPVSPEQRRTMVKLPAGGDYISTMVLARAHEQGLQTQSTPLASFEEQMSRAKDLIVLSEVAGAFAQTVADLLLHAQSELWRSTLLYYGMLQHNARTDADLAAKMQPLNDYFARRSTAVREEQAVARAERKVAHATKKAAQAKKAADAIKARRAEAEVDFVIMPAAVDENAAPKANVATP